MEYLEGIEDIEDIEEYIKERDEGEKASLIATLLAVKKIIEVSDNKQSVIDAIDDIVNEIKKADDSE